MKTRWFILAALMTSPACAAQVKLECPETIHAKSSVVAPAGWEVVEGQFSPMFEGITIFEGHPKGMASQAPDELPPRNGVLTVRWRVGDNTWLQCRYTGTTSTIAKRLPKGLHTCSASYRQRQVSPNPPERILCE